MAAVLAGLVAGLVATIGADVATAPPAEARKRTWTLASPLAREVVRPGAADRGVYDIAHVRELQIRLRRVGVYQGPVTGRYTRPTLRAVKAFQRRVGAPANGTVGYRTWKPLIRKTVLGRRAVPKACKAAGWHACYDRSRHQVNLYRDGTLHQSWLARGGASHEQTRTGSFSVFRRSERHVSSLYDSPMPYAQFFSGGQALHGSVSMIDPYDGHSHGCVNLWIEDARQLWDLTHDQPLGVHVYGAWA